MVVADVTDPSPTQQLHDWLAAFEHALRDRDAPAVAALFAGRECFWRDFVAFTWNIATMDGREAIRAMLAAQLDVVLPVRIKPEGDATVVDGVVQGWFDFETASARGKGHVRLKDGEAWTVMTAMLELKGHEEPAGRRRPDGVEHRAVKDRVTWSDERAETRATLGFEVQPYCLIIGGGQGGLALGARLKRLGVPTLIVDALEKPGDAWRQRYKSLYLHDPVWIDHLPYLPFPDHWPVYTHKDKMGDWLEAYCSIMELDFWGSSVCRSARYDEKTESWEVVIERADGAVVLRPKQLVIATGLSGAPRMPEFRGAEAFEGVLCHSSDYENAEAFRGKRVAVIGSNSSAHDICVDLWGVDADVTMIQRSLTCVVKATALLHIAKRGPFSEDAVARGVTTERADLMVGSMPFRFREKVDRANCELVQREDAEFYERLRASGFLLHFGEDNTAIGGMYMRRASGYYIDVGGSDLIIDGGIKVKSGVGVAEIKPHSIVLTDGSELPVDAIICATGYEPMESWIERLISKDMAERVGRLWGLGSDTALDPGPWEGELRNMWKPTAQEGLWFQGGNLAQSRFHSLHLALQLKARMEGVATPVHQPRSFQRPALQANASAG
ncbi:MAG TPA: NAD(P)/FAD-dependent oxidoreductase [Caulobacterales bacterium]|nr:NAD(P)/FAD-dependent oxidoreductase [Caulobacterales bacterium]